MITRKNRIDPINNMSKYNVVHRMYATIDTRANVTDNMMNVLNVQMI
jgi:hypothetical protein